MIAAVLRAAVYCRVSGADDPRMASLDSQAEGAADHARRAGVPDRTRRPLRGPIYRRGTLRPPGTFLTAIAVVVATKSRGFNGTGRTRNH